jgi:hypothetical protein
MLDLIFDPAVAIVLKRKMVLGETTREEFKTKFTGAGEVYMRHFQDFLFATYERKSFPETFFHPQIAQSLCATGKLSDPNTIEQRITETGAIMVAALDKKKGLGIMLGLAKSHERRNQNLYNEDTVEFTLLTFSDYGAKAAAITEPEECSSIGKLSAPCSACRPAACTITKPKRS